MSNLTALAMLTSVASRHKLACVTNLLKDNRHEVCNPDQTGKHIITSFATCFLPQYKLSKITFV